MKAQKREELRNLMNKLTVGLEVEQVGLDRWEGNRVLRDINSQFQGQEQWKIVSDSSIRGTGCEFVSGIMNYSSLHLIQESVRKIRRNGGREHSSCGIHVHIDGERFLKDPKALIRLIKIVNRYERHMYHALKADSITEGQDRMTGSCWSKPVCQSFYNRVMSLKNPSIKEIKREWYLLSGGNEFIRYDESRYRLLNLHALFSKKTVEFRCFNSTLHAGRIKAYIQLSLMICCQALLTTKASKGTRKFDEKKAHYEVRTWLLRLGAIGDEFKTMRTHLTRHLDGNASWHK